MSKSTYLHMYKCILVCLPLLLVFLSTCILGSLSTCQHVFSFVYFYCLSTCLLIFLSTNLLVFLSTCLRFILSICLLVFVSTGLLFIFSTCLRYNTFYLVYLYTCFLFYFLSYLPAYLSTCNLSTYFLSSVCLLPVYLPVCLRARCSRTLPFISVSATPKTRRIWRRPAAGTCVSNTGSRNRFSSIVYTPTITSSLINTLLLL